MVRPNTKGGIKLSEQEGVVWSSHLMEFVWANCVIGMAFVTTEGGWLRANPSLCKLLGYTEDELRERTWMELTDPRDTKPDLDAVKQVVAGERNSYTMLKRYITKFGGLVPVELTVVPWRGEDGERVAFFLSQLVPISDRGEVQNVKIVTEDEEAAAAFRFMKKHWKWVLGMLLLMLSAETIAKVGTVLGLFAK